MTEPTTSARRADPPRRPRRARAARRRLLRRAATGQRLRRLRDRARHAVGTGRQLWPAATLAEYRLALLAPADVGGGRARRGIGRFTIGPLTEVVAQHHTWAELAPLLEPGPRAALVAHERALRGEAIDGDSVAELPDVLDLPYRIAGWEPAYPLAVYHDAGAEFPSPPMPGARADVDAAGTPSRTCSTTRPSSWPCASSSSRGRPAPTVAPRSSPSRATPRRRCVRSA